MTSRGTLCAIAAVGLHAFAARALPRHSHASVAVPVADAPAPSVDIEEAPPDGEPASPEVKETTAPTPAPAPARAAPAPAAKTKIESTPEDHASDVTAASTTGEGEVSEGDGANGDGRGARGGAGEGGGQEGPADAPPGPAAKAHKPTGPAKLDVSRDWSKCPFPENSKRDRAFVRLRVTVGALGDAVDVKVLADPGDGFGAAASACAKTHRYVAGKNEEGVAEETETEPFLVFFTR